MTQPDPTLPYPDIAAHGSLSEALRAVAQGQLNPVQITTPDASPMTFAAVASALPHRNPLEISAWPHERRWSIWGTDSYQGLALIDGRTDDLDQIVAACFGWYCGEALSDIQRVAPFVHLTGRFEVPDLDPARLTDSEWGRMRTEASELKYPWAPDYRTLIEAAHAEPTLRRLYPFKSMWDLRFSTTTRPRLTAVGPMLGVEASDRYIVIDGSYDTEFSTAHEAVAAAARQIASGLPPVALGG